MKKHPFLMVVLAVYMLCSFVWSLGILRFLFGAAGVNPLGASGKGLEAYAGIGMALGVGLSWVAVPFNQGRRWAYGVVLGILSLSLLALLVLMGKDLFGNTALTGRHIVSRVILLIFFGGIVGYLLRPAIRTDLMGRVERIRCGSGAPPGGGTDRRSG